MERGRGDVAQRESTCFARRGSGVRIPSSPPRNSAFDEAFRGISLERVPSPSRLYSQTTANRSRPANTASPECHGEGGRRRRWMCYSRTWAAREAVRPLGHRGARQTCVGPFFFSGNSGCRNRIGCGQVVGRSGAASNQVFGLTSRHGISDRSLVPGGTRLRLQRGRPKFLRKASRSS